LFFAFATLDLTNQIKQCHRIATRYDKLAADDLAAQLASIKVWLRAHESLAIYMAGGAIYRCAAGYWIVRLRGR
jgi:hypothetical protein